MSGSSAKRKNSSGGAATCKRKKDTEATATSAKAGVAAAGKDVFCIIEADGTVEDSKTWGPTMPVDMRRWLPAKMVQLIQGSVVGVEA